MTRPSIFGPKPSQAKAPSALSERKSGRVFYLAPKPQSNRPGGTLAMTGGPLLGELPWRKRYTAEWFLKEYGIGHKMPIGGIFSQFPDVDWKEETDCIMEQLVAAQRRLTDYPIPGFKVKKTIEPEPVKNWSRGWFYKFSERG